MGKLGYTFYPKDWRTDDKVLMLNAEQRDAYRFLIDECFMKKSSRIETNFKYFRKVLGHNSQKLERIFEVLLNFSLIIKDDDCYVVPSTVKRLGVITEASNGGKKSTRLGIKNVTKEKEKEKENIYTETDFLFNWKKCRKDYLSEVTHILKLTPWEKQYLNDALKDHNKTQINEALICFFKQEQKTIPAMYIKPSHFLENISKYYNASLNKNFNLYASKN